MSNAHTDTIPFSRRHIGPGAADQKAMLGELGCTSLGEFIATVVPAAIRSNSASSPLSSTTKTRGPAAASVAGVSA